MDYAPEMCPRCYKPRDPAEFTSPTGRTYLSCATCRASSRDSNRRRRLNQDPALLRADNLRQKYGITPEEYDALREAQSYRCAICGGHESEVASLSSRGRPRLDGRPNAPGFALVVDHCHDSNQVRGLLCHPCNIALGAFKDSPQIMLAAVQYITSRKSGEQRAA